MCRPTHGASSGIWNGFCYPSARWVISQGGTPVSQLHECGRRAWSVPGFPAENCIFLTKQSPWDMVYLQTTRKVSFSGIKPPKCTVGRGPGGWQRLFPSQKAWLHFFLPCLVVSLMIWSLL